MNIGIHPVTDHGRIFGVGSQLIETSSEHHRVGLTHEIGFTTGSLGNHGRYGSYCRERAILRRAGSIRVGTNKLGTLFNQADSFSNIDEIVEAGFPQDYIFRIAFGHYITCLVDCGGQSGFPNNERGRLGGLAI